MSAASSPRPVPPPSHQEVTRKLSVHSVAKPVIKNPTITTAPVSGTESDSDSMFSSDIISPTSLGSMMGGLSLGSSSAQTPLSVIAERRSGSGEESEEDEEEEGGWRAQNPLQGTQDETVLKTGYLWKKGERRKTWKKRWFVLRPAHLAFYKTSAEYKLLRLLDLADVHSCTPVQLKKHVNTFGLVSPTRTFYLQAESPQEVSEWVKAISDARNALMATSTQNSVTAPIPIPGSGSGARNAPVPASPSHSPYAHHLTSSESEDASPSQTRSYTIATPATPVVAEVASPTKPTPIDPSKVILSGYLMKCGSRRHTWHNRWFVLSGDKLVYSRSHMDTKPHRAIPLTLILDALEYDLPPNRNVPTSPTVSPSHYSGGNDDPDADEKHTFKIVTTKRTLLLCAPSEEEEIRWLSAVRALIARRSGAGVVPGDSAVVVPGSKTSASASTPASNIAEYSGHGHIPSASSATAGSAAMASAPVTAAGSSGVASGRRRESFARRLSLNTGAASTAVPQDTTI